jgi:hypothetical protein
VFDTALIDVVVALIFVFFVFSLLVSGMNELVRKALNTRAKGLWTALRRMLDEGEHEYRTDWSPVIGDAPPRLTGTGIAPPQTQSADGSVTCATLFDQFFNHPVISRLDATPTGKPSRLSHIPPPDFARAMVDILTPRNGDGEPDWTRIGEKIQELPAPLRSQLEPLWGEAQKNVEQFRAGLESWFDASMERVTDWYKKRTRWAMLVYGLLVAVVFNVSAVVVTLDLYENEVVRDTVIGLAAQRIATAGEIGADVTACTDRDCFRNEVQQIADTELPVFWRRCPPGSGTVCGFENNGRIAATIIGWLVTAAALSMGASFWFAVLKRAFRIRSQVTGQPAS